MLAARLEEDVCCTAEEALQRPGRLSRFGRQQMIEPDSYLAFDLETVPAENGFSLKHLHEQLGEAAADIDWVREESTDYRRARIVAAAIAGRVDGERLKKAWVADSRRHEGSLLLHLWAELGSAHDAGATLVTFNGLAFDVPLLYWRSAILQIKPSIRKSRLSRRFQYSGHFDIRAVLGDFDRFRTGTLAEYCDWFGIRNPKTSMSGSEVWRAVAKEDWDSLRAYVTSDALATANLYRRVACYYS